MTPWQWQPPKWYWVKHHAATLALISLALFGTVFFLWGKSSVVIMDTNPAPKQFKAGVKHLGRYWIEPAYSYKDATVYDVVCSEGIKLLVIQEGYQVINLGVCE